MPPPLARPRSRCNMEVVRAIHILTASIALACAMGGCGHGHAGTESAPDAALAFDAFPDVFDPTGRVPKMHRPSPPTCSRERPPGNAMPELADTDHSDCTTDADCTAGINGRCNLIRGRVGAR